MTIPVKFFFERGILHVYIFPQAELVLCIAFGAFCRLIFVAKLAAAMHMTLLMLLASYHIMAAH